ncbi:zinc-dependent alcohol dehydrogenase family protein [Ruegeria sediminis]|uniref:Zinc-dependent alcohol dehydrogenase family protein n=2 Tax=Ruegeria sediminis TaxID=2583820 RepID=A0ABY2WT55_9RHOB|nr:zinc-dependent alcohol dehydrogenase family protein [Ruegeria sediminis]
MRAMLLTEQGQPLMLSEVPRPDPAPGEVLIRIDACGVCRTDLHVIDGDLTEPKLPLILGHEIVGKVVESNAADALAPGLRVGVPWLGRTCGCCHYCLHESENLCDAPLFTGYTRDGGYAEYCVADARYVFAMPDGPDSAELAPLLCAGLIGHRSLRFAGDAQTIGIYGFGAAAHIVAQVAKWEGRRVLAFTRPGDAEAQSFALRMGADWAGGSDQPAPEPLDAAILFAPVGGLVPAALRATRKGGVVVCGGIHMSDIPQFPYDILWGERAVKSVANLTRKDGEEFFRIVASAGIRTEIEKFRLEDANTAIDRLRQGRLSGAAVLVNR